MKKYLIILSLLVTFSVKAQIEISIAAGSSSGIYELVLSQIQSVTSESGITFKKVPSHGAVENLDLLIGNKVSAAFMHNDVIAFRGQAEDLSKFKTLLALFNEQVHFLALTTSKRKVGGTLGYGAKPIVINEFESLKGLTVGAAGGGYITAQVIRLQSQVAYNVMQFESGKEVMEALNKGEIDSAVFVGAAPLPNLENLGKEYKLIPITGSVQDRLKQVYKPSTVTYIKMSASSVPTVSAQCLLVSKTYKTPKFVAQLWEFRESFFKHLDEIKETPNMHKGWAEVDAEDHGKWPWLELTNTVGNIK